MTTVHIYLPTQTERVTAETPFIRALSIPLEDIKRFTIRPLKWLRFATFAVCGAKGHLSASKGGEMVDYEHVTFENLADEYYYQPDGLYHFVDHRAFNDQMTSSSATTGRFRFRQDVCDRDHTCVITRVGPRDCDAAHIIPHSKGDDYIARVVEDRLSLYDQLPFESGIDCVQNGILLAKNLHSIFADARLVFLRTPNFAMDPADVPRLEDGPIPHTRTTLQYMEPPQGLLPTPQWDARADWSSDLAPPSLLLDFMYGAAVVKYWMCDGLREMLDERHKSHFSFDLGDDENSHDDNEDDSENAEQSDRSAGPSKRSPEKGKQKVRKTFSSDASASVLDAMDKLLLSTWMKGPTPQCVIAEREKRAKESELRSQEQNVEKVQQWLDSSRSS